MPSEKKPNWKAIKTAYLKGGVSYQELADKHGVSKRTIERHAASENWAEDCRQVVGKVSAEISGVVADVILDEAAKVTRQQLEDWAEAGRIARSLLLSVADPGDLRDWTSAYKNIQAGQRLALGLEKKDGGETVNANADLPLLDEHSDPADLERRYRESLG